jgi:hypothetical protein
VIEYHFLEIFPSKISRCDIMENKNSVKRLSQFFTNYTNETDSVRNLKMEKPNIVTGNFQNIKEELSKFNLSEGLIKSIKCRNEVESIVPDNLPEHLEEKKSPNKIDLERKKAINKSFYLGQTILLSLNVRE